MNKITLTLVSIVAAISLSAQSKLNLEAQMMLENLREARINDGRLKTLGGRQPVMTLSADELDVLHVILRMQPDADVSQLEALGVNIRTVIGDGFYTADIPVAVVDEVEALSTVESISVGRMLTPKMDKARLAVKADYVQLGSDNVKAYDGEGVIIGVCDTGFDPHHVAFIDSETGQSRVKYICNNKGSEWETPEEISQYVPETSMTSHGTHVLGIAAAGTVDGMKYDFVGIAPKSDIILASLPYYGASETQVLEAVEKFVDYAETQGKPLSVNISLGINGGSHDGTSDFSRSLALLGEKAIISVSAGNEGNCAIALSKDFESDDDVLKTVMVPIAELDVSSSGNLNNNKPEETIDIWMADETDVVVAFEVFDKTTQSVVYSHEFTTNSGTLRYNGGTTNADLGEYFYGSIVYYEGLDRNSGRRHASLQYALESTQYKKTGSLEQNNFYAALTVKAAAGAHVDMYCSTAYNEFSSLTTDGYSEGSYDGTINELACGDNVIAVGSFASRSTINKLKSDGTYSLMKFSGIRVSRPSEFSSFGKRADGTYLPHFLAPGQVVVSSLNSSYVNGSYIYSLYNETCDYVTDADGNIHYWGPMQGTSMACPVSTGVMALWLQAKPEMTVDEAIEVAQSTAIVDTYISNATYPNQCGAGKINALDGIKKLLGVDDNNSGISDEFADDDKSVLVSNLDNGRCEVFVARGKRFIAGLYNLAGHLVRSANGINGVAHFNLSDLSKGVYVMNVVGDNVAYNTKILVK